MSADPSGWAGAAVAGFTKVVAGFVQSRGRPICRIACVETAGGGRNVEHRPMPERASGSSTTRTRLPVSAGTSDHDNGGEISAPSQVYCAGISPLGGIAGLASIRGMTVSVLPEFHSPDTDKKRAFHEERVMSETTRFRSGLLVFPNLTQLDLTGPYEVLARLPGAETLLLWKNTDPVRSEHGLTILPTATLDSSEPLDLILVPGGAWINPL